MSIEDARKIILDRVSPEIFLAKQSASIWQSIGEFSKALNGTIHQQVFGIIQIQALSSLVLSLGKLFERPGMKYPNFSISTAIEHLKGDIQNVTVNSASVSKVVNDLTNDQGCRAYLLANPDEIGQILLKEFADDCPQSPERPGSVLDGCLEKIKVIRDKQVAHSEDAELTSLPVADWEAVGQLIAFAETFVNLVGYGFFGFSLKGRVEAKDLDFKAQPAGRSLKVLLENLTSNNALQPTRKTRG